MALQAEYRPLVVGVKEAPPFVIRGEGEAWSGLAVSVWEAAAEDLNLTFTYRPMALDALLDATANGDVDVGIGALSITPEREAQLDFTHAYFTSGLGIAVQDHKGLGWLGVISGLFSPAFLKVVLVLSLVLLMSGLLVWLFERRRNPQFGGRSGIGSGFWWAAVTMTTVGYGDKAPVTLGGRVVALLWMFASLIIISSFTAAITTSLTVDRLGSDILSPSDLAKAGVRVATLGGSSSEEWLRNEQIAYQTYPEIHEALEALTVGGANAVVFDKPLLNYAIKDGAHDVLKVLPHTFRIQHYGFAVSQGSALREPLDRAVLRFLDTDLWADVVFLYLDRRL